MQKQNDGPIEVVSVKEGQCNNTNLLGSSETKKLRQEESNWQGQVWGKIMQNIKNTV